MQVGHFFKLDKNSFLHKGEVIFRYLRIQSDKTQPIYPIYISFKKHRIDFNFHGYLFNKSLKNYEFIETTLLSLHLSTHKTVINKLNDTLENVYNSQFPFLNNYILDTEKKDEKNLKRFNIIDNDNKDKNKNIVSFANLDLFRASKQDEQNAIEGLNENDNKTGYKLLLRHLLLDFIYDIEYSEIFQACPYFTDAHNLLQENLLFQAITTKAKFYLSINKFNDTNLRINKEKKKQPKYSISTKTDKNNKNEYFINQQKEQVKKTKNEWVDIIKNPQADNVIKGKRKKKYWFTEIEKELVNVYNKTEPILEPKQKIFKKSRDLRDRRRSADWLISRYNIIDSFNLVFRKETIIIIALIAGLFTLGFEIFEKQETPNTEGEIFDFLKLSFILGFIFYISSIIFMLFRIGFAYTFKLIFFNLIIVFFSSLLLTFDIDTVRNSLFNTKVISPEFLTPFLFLILLSFAFIYSIERYERHIDNWKKSLKKVFFLFFLSLFYTFSISIIIPSIFGSERFSQEDFLENHWEKVANTYKNSPKEFKKYIDDKNDIVKLTKLVYPYFYKDDNKQINELPNYILIKNNTTNKNDTILLVFGYEPIKKTKKMEKKSISKDDQLYNMLDILKVKDSNAKIKYRISFINKDILNIDIFPALSLMNTILALLIGIFVQLIINRKRLTDN